MKTNQAQNTDEITEELIDFIDNYESPQEKRQQRLEVVDQMLRYHSTLLEVGRPAPSAYIPYQRVYDEYRKQHHRAINRLRKLKEMLIKEEEGE